MKRPFTALISLLSIAMLAYLLVQNSAYAQFPEEPCDVFCDPYFDPPFSCIHHLFPNAGWLENASPLLFGIGYYNTHSHVLHSYACPNGMLGTIGDVGAAWFPRTPRVGIIDISLWPSGGPFPPHKRHQNGLDVDVRYVRNDGLEAPLNLDVEPARYDRARTQLLIDMFCGLGFGGRKIRTVAEANLSPPAGCSLKLDPANDRDHNNHFHVDRSDPDGFLN